MKAIMEMDVEIQERQIDIVYILNDGAAVMQREIKPYAPFFNWVDLNHIQELVRNLKLQTDGYRKSIVAIFESGEIRTYSNISHNFTQYNLLNKFAS